MGLLIDRVRWIGGSPCSGKSTVARWLADAGAARLYSCDDAFDRHAGAVTAQLGPTLKKVTSLPVEQRLAQRIDVQVADVFRLAREEWPQILNDLEHLAGNVVVEGAALLPELLVAIGVTPDHAMWVVPTESFQRRHYARRAWVRELVQNTTDPDIAFDRWMQRDAQFATEVATQARELGYHVLVTTDGSSVQGHQAALGQALAPLLR